MQEDASRSCEALSNVYLIAAICADTAESGLSKVGAKMGVEVTNVELINNIVGHHRRAADERLQEMLRNEPAVVQHVRSAKIIPIYAILLLSSSN